MTSLADHHVAATQKALDTIEANLGEPIELERLARGSGVSFWHFQRIFGALVGEPLGSYIRRRRLTAAAHELRHTRRRIVDIAQDFQFDSHESFTRAFRTEFRLAPSEFRRHPRLIPEARVRITAERLEHLFRITMQPAIVELPALHLTGLSTRFISALSANANNMLVIPKLWEHFFARIQEITQRSDAFCYGACDCLRAGERSDPDELQYLAGLATAPDAPVPSGMVRWTAPAGTYACFTHRGPIRNLAQTINYVYAAWLPRSEYVRSESFEFERYDDRFSPESETSELDFLVPIVRREK